MASLPRQSAVPWHHCSLSLSPCQNLVITPHGVIYDRAAILANMLHQKRTLNAAATSEAAHRAATARAENSQQRRRAVRERETFEAKQRALPSSQHDPATREDATPTRTPNFWLPAAQPGVAKQKRGKERKESRGMSKRVLCPVLKKPLKVAHLIALRPTKAPASGVAEHGDGGDEGGGEFMCPVCQRALVNGAKPVALRTGSVVCAACMRRFVDGQKADPVSGDSICEKDIIPIFQR